jgi:hypothetical protein
MVVFCCTALWSLTALNVITSIELMREKAEKYNITLGHDEELAYRVNGFLVMNMW